MGTFKDGLEYFSLDTDFLNDKKIRYLRGNFGVKGVYIYMYLLCCIYRDKGYYISVEPDDFLLMSQDIGEGVGSGLIQEVILECLKRGLFNEPVYKRFHILTSEGIQKRYIRSKAKNENIFIYQEYWLLDSTDKKVVPAGILNKIVFKTLDREIESLNSPVESLNSSVERQSKVNKSKVKESKREREESSAPTLAEVTAYAKERNSNVNPERFFDYYQSQNWKCGNTAITDWQAKFRCWEKSEKGNTSTAPKINPHSFFNYEQRVYTDEDFAEMQRRNKARQKK